MQIPGREKRMKKLGSAKWLDLCKDSGSVSGSARQALVSRNSPGKNPGVGSHSLLQGYSPPRDQTQVSCIACGFFTI